MVESPLQEKLVQLLGAERCNESLRALAAGEVVSPGGERCSQSAVLFGAIHLEAVQ